MRQRKELRLVMKQRDALLLPLTIAAIVIARTATIAITTITTAAKLPPRGQRHPPQLRKQGEIAVQARVAAAHCACITWAPASVTAVAVHTRVRACTDTRSNTKCTPLLPCVRVGVHARARTLTRARIRARARTRAHTHARTRIRARVLSVPSLRVDAFPEQHQSRGRQQAANEVSVDQRVDGARLGRDPGGGSFGGSARGVPGAVGGGGGGVDVPRQQMALLVV